MWVCGLGVWELRNDWMVGVRREGIKVTGEDRGEEYYKRESFKATGEVQGEEYCQREGFKATGEV